MVTDPTLIYLLLMSAGLGLDKGGAAVFEIVSKVLKPRLIAVFVGVLGRGILLVGLLFTLLI